ncbi:MAG: glycosyltransferase, partial [Acidobacteriota bacterium]
IENPTNQGFAHPCNQGAQAASGRVVAFINNDMRADRGWLDEALPLLQGPVACVASRILDWEGRKIDFNGSSMQYLGFALQSDLGRLVEEVSHQDRILFPCGGAFLVDREVFLEVGGFDASYFAVFEDVDLGWRLWLSGYEVAFAPRSQTFHRGHATFEQHADAKMRYLMHRNALMTIFKNYQEENFQRILPLALRMAVKRAVLLSGVRKESFYLWAQARHELRSGDRLVQERWIDALNHLIALDDVLESLPRLMEERRRIQARRKRSDEEILALFNDPMRRIVEDVEYDMEEASWMESLQLDRLFQPRLEGPALEERWGEKLKQMRAELNAARWVANAAWQHPPAPSRPRLGSLLRSLRRNGLRITWNRILHRVRHGS